VPTVIASSILHDLSHIEISLVEKTVRTVAVYAGIVLILRVSGKRNLAQLNTLDLVVLLLLSNVVQNAIIGPDNSLLGGLVGAAILVTVNAIFVRAMRNSHTAVELLEGKPTSLVTDGRFNEEEVGHLGLRDSDVMNAIRRQGADRIDEVADATLYPGGAIVVRLHPGDEDASKDDIARLEAKLDALLARP
jgi:uncharacterized membrane protein YcaP (DUF421 family)